MTSWDAKKANRCLFKYGFIFPIIICTLPIYYPLFICFTNVFCCSTERFVQLAVIDGSSKTLVSRFPVFQCMFTVVSQSSFLLLHYSSLCAYFFISTYLLKNSWFFYPIQAISLEESSTFLPRLMIYISYKIISKSIYLWGFSGETGYPQLPKIKYNSLRRPQNIYTFRQ